MPRLLHIADVHLGASFSAFGDLAEPRREAVLEAVRALPEAAEREDAHAVVVAGDLFDSGDPPEAARAVVVEAFRRLGEAGRPVFVIPGNHDAATLRPNPWDEPLAGAHVFTDPEFGDPVMVETAAGALNVYGFAYDRARCPDPLATFRRADREGAHVVLVHGPTRDAPHWSSSGNALPLEHDALAALDADYIALGDYHRHRPPSEFAADDSVPACYAGSFAALDVTEHGTRGYVAVDVEPGRAPVVDLRSSGVTPVANLGAIDVTGRENVAEVVERVVEALNAHAGASEDQDGRADAAASVGEDAAIAVPVVHLVGAPEFPLSGDDVARHLAERFGHAKVEDATRYYDSARLNELAERDTVAGHVVRLGRRRIEDAEDEDARRVADHALRLALDALEV